MQERLGIAGSGAIACGLAATAAEHGAVVLWARSDASARRAQEQIDSGGEEARGKGVTVTTDVSDLGDATFVVEAIAEEHGAKAALLTELDELLAPDVLLGTTTSSLSVAELAVASGRPDRFVALHVFNPVERMKLVELAFPEQAAQSTRERARALCEALGKTAVEVPDVAGFVVNRLLFPYLFSAVELLEQTGMEVEALDTCMKLGAGHPMGPLALLDLIGLDVALAIGEEIGAEVPGRVRALAAEGATGRKAGRGFYAY